MAPRLVRMSRLCVLVAVAALVSGCRVATDVDIAVQRDGHGTISVTVDLDREAADRIPDLPGQLRTDDLHRAGWRISGPNRTPSGGFRVVARKPFVRPEQAGAVLEELTGKGGPFRDFLVRRSHSFATTTYVVRGRVDLRPGLAAFSDPQVAALLGGQPLGRSEIVLRELAGRSPADAAPFTVTVHLPGGVDRRYPARLGGPPVPVEARANVTATKPYVLLASAFLALVAAVAVILLEQRWRRRVPRRMRGVGVYDRHPYETMPEAGGGRPPGIGERP